MRWLIYRHLPNNQRHVLMVLFFSLLDTKWMGKNYVQWSYVVMMFICGKGKDYYLIGVVPRPMKEESKFTWWKLENNMVTPYLINSMNNDVWEHFILYKTMKIIKKVTRETYYDAEDIVKAFDMEKIFHDLRQDDLSITPYFNLLTCYWQQLDIF